MDRQEMILMQMIRNQEGGYSNDLKDSGGETYLGISRVYFPKWEGWKIVDENKPLKKYEIIDNRNLDDLIIKFYEINFYESSKAELIRDPLIAAHVFSHAVNGGKVTAAKMLQRAINKTFNSGLVIDGKIGPKTLQIVNSNIRNNSLRDNMANERRSFYYDIVKRKPKNQKFLKGWLNRIENTIYW